MELVVGASTMKPLMGKLERLLAQEYTLIRGVNGDLQYINDELRTTQSFLRAVGKGHAHGPEDLMDDWMKQIRDITYDIEDCIDDSADRLHGLPTGMCCYFLVNSVYEVLTWWPRRDVAARISVLKMRAEQIGERRTRYGVSNPETGAGNTAKHITVARFIPADNQEESLQLVVVKEPVGVDEHTKELKNWLTCIVGFGGVGKTAIATALYNKNWDNGRFQHRAMVTVSQTSDLEVIFRSIQSAVNRQTLGRDVARLELGSTDQNPITSVISRGTSAVNGFMAKCFRADTSHEDRTKRLDKLKNDLKTQLEQESHLILIDDVWSAMTLKEILNGLPCKADSRIIVTTRFDDVAKTHRGADIRRVGGLNEDQSRILFARALSESKRTKIVTSQPTAFATPQPKTEENVHSIDESVQLPDKDVIESFPDVWKMCGGLPLAIVTMAGHVACNPQKLEDWSQLPSTLFLENAGRKGITQEEVGRIISHCYDDMPAEIKTCSLYLSIFSKGQEISRKRLTRRWIAEGFVSEKQGLRVEEVADTYFNHLIRRKIIQPVEHSSSGKVKKCKVHDMILEHIVAKASEENFITVVGGNWLMEQPSSKIRPLSLQASDSKRSKDTEKMNLSHVRSLTIFRSLNNQLPNNSLKLGIVQVLDLEGCEGIKGRHTKEICKMHLLKYLSLRKSDIKKLSSKIENLKRLETLDIRETKIGLLPNTICQLDQLVNILGGNKKTHMSLKLPEGFKQKKMKGLHILSGIEIDEGSADIRHLTELRKLAIYKLKTLRNEECLATLSTSIQYLCGHSLTNLIIDDESSEFVKSLDGMSSSPLRFLVALKLSGKIVKLPSWIEQLTTLTKLTVSVTALRTDNLKQLSNLGELFSLTFSFPFIAEKQDPEMLIILAKNKLLAFCGGEIRVPDGGFKSLKLLCISAPILPLLRFSEKAMPELERFELQYTMLEGFYGTENLEKLREVHLTVYGEAGVGITNEMVNEIKSTKRIHGDTPQIIKHQQHTQI